MALRDALRFDPCVGKILWWRAWQPTPVFLLGESAWTEKPGGLQSVGLKEPDMTERLHFHFSLSCFGEGNGNPLQCSCLENPRDGRYPWEDGERWPVGGSLNYKTVSQLDRFCRKQGTWVEVTYVLAFFLRRGMLDLRPKSIDLTVKPSAPSCPPPLAPYPGLPTEQTESQGTDPHHHPRKGCLGLNKNPSTSLNQDHCEKYQ